MATISLIIAIAGLVIYLVVRATGRDEGIAEVGRIAFAVGLLAYLLKG